MEKEEDHIIYEDLRIYLALKALKSWCMLSICTQLQLNIDIINEIVHIVGYHEFYNDAIELCMEVKDDYPRWKVKE
jgi:hypothetical protein